MTTTIVTTLGRVFLSLIFIASGIGKAATPAATKAFIAAAGLPLPDIAYVVAVAVEVGGGLALLLGFQARRVAAGLALFCIVTAVGFHTDFADRNQLIHFLKNIAITGGMLQVFAFGGGAFSIDSRLAARRG